MPTHDERDTVGYKRPPKGSQFRPGVSGNPRGRPKASPTLRTDLALELGATVQTPEGAVSKQRAVLKAIIAAAVDGDVRAAAMILDLSARIIGVDAPDSDEVTAGAADEQVLEEFVAREISRRSPSSDNK